MSDPLDQNDVEARSKATVDQMLKALGQQVAYVDRSRDVEAPNGHEVYEFNDDLQRLLNELLDVIKRNIEIVAKAGPHLTFGVLGNVAANLLVHAHDDARAHLLNTLTGTAELMIAHHERQQRK